MNNVKVVITGADSYIGNSIQAYIQNNYKSIDICQLDVVGDAWRTFDFSQYDVVIHVAAIVHHKDISSWELYNKVNVELTEEIARKAKRQGVKQFIFFSSMAVYGINKSLSNKKSIISERARPNPSSLYGKSKWLAEQKLAQIEDENFKVAIVRPPNVYGPGCKGGYISTYMRIVEKLPAIPKAFTSVKQSILYIDNLSEFIYLLIVRQQAGIYTPQDNESLCAVELMQYISEALNLKKKLSSFLGLFMYAGFFIPLIVKGYGGVSYDKQRSHHEEFNYLIVPCKEGIKRTVQYGVKYNNTGI